MAFVHLPACARALDPVAGVCNCIGRDMRIDALVSKINTRQHSDTDLEEFLALLSMPDPKET